MASDSENIVASYHLANSYVELDNYQEAMTIYESILGQSINIDPIQWRKPVPTRKDMYPMLCDNIKLIEEKKLAIMLLKGNSGSRLMCINTATKDSVWEKTINDQFV